MKGTVRGPNPGPEGSKIPNRGSQVVAEQSLEVSHDKWAEHDNRPADAGRPEFCSLNQGRDTIAPRLERL
jgi:hypothetical protein